MIAEQRLGKMLDKAKNKGELRPYVRNLNVQWFRFALDDVLEMRIPDDEVREFLLQEGDLLICEGGEPGRAAIWRDVGQPMFFQKALHRVRPIPDVLPEFLAYRFRLDTWTGALDKLFTGATIKHLTGKALKEHRFPLPPLPEQKRIVEKSTSSWPCATS
jgi:type I restriction enzyme S subunit